MATDTVDKLNSFLRGEIAAVETYRQAIEKLRHKPEVGTLSDCMRVESRLPVVGIAGPRPI
jgi:hypothetical protein